MIRPSHHPLRLHQYTYQTNNSVANFSGRPPPPFPSLPPPSLDATAAQGVCLLLGKYEPWVIAFHYSPSCLEHGFILGAVDPSCLSDSIVWNELSGPNSPFADQPLPRLWRRSSTNHAYSHMRNIWIRMEPFKISSPCPAFQLLNSDLLCFSTVGPQFALITRARVSEIYTTIS